MRTGKSQRTWKVKGLLAWHTPCFKRPLSREQGAKSAERRAQGLKTEEGIRCFCSPLYALCCVARGTENKLEQLLVTSGILLAFFFAFVSGVHDGGNLVAASALSRSIAPQRALLLATAAVFVGPLLYGSAVAVTLSEVFLERIIIQPSNRIALCLFLVSGVTSATLWNVMTWWVGRPSGSSYTLVGGLLGAAVAAFGFEVIHGWTLLFKVILFLLLSPVVGAVVAWLGMSMASRFGREPGGPWIGLQGLSLFFEGMGHGANNAQKSAAVILMLLLSSGSSSEGQIPFWAILGCSASLAAGVPVGGWKIARILSGKTFKIQPVHSFASQVSAGVVLAGANLLGGVLSPNQLVKACVLGTGAGGKKETPCRILGKSMIMAWVIHLPACALIAAAIHWCASRALGLGMGSLERIMGGLGP
jgi:PiT family inorganic phosphate transporter